MFGMEERLPPNSELVQAVLRLFQEPVPKAALRRHELLSPRSDQARVVIQWLHVREDGSNRTSLIDSRWGGWAGPNTGEREGWEEIRGGTCLGHAGRGMGGA